LSKLLFHISFVIVLNPLSMLAVHSVLTQRVFLYNGKTIEWRWSEFISFFSFFFFTLGVGVFVLQNMQELTPELRSDIDAMVQRGGHIWSFL
jgi:hypothetical protein